MTTVILPCAGLGTRLGLPYPKEIHRVSEGLSLIDFSLNHIRLSDRSIEKIVIVIRPGKEVVFDYVKESMSEYKVIPTYFNNDYSEWPGSVKSAEKLFSDVNIVLLPDSIIETKNKNSLLNAYDKVFSTDAEICFSYHKPSNSSKLKDLGALYVDKEENIKSFCDKPKLSKNIIYNAYWTSFGFRKIKSELLLELMMKSVARESVHITEISDKIKGFPVDNYQDLGTWEAINSFLYSNIKGN